MQNATSKDTERLWSCWLAVPMLVIKLPRLTLFLHLKHQPLTVWSFQAAKKEFSG